MIIRLDPTLILHSHSFLCSLEIKGAIKNLLYVWNFFFNFELFIVSLFLKLFQKIVMTCAGIIAILNGLAQIWTANISEIDAIVLIIITIDSIICSDE